jgi:hypothetical protein
MFFRLTVEISWESTRQQNGHPEKHVYSDIDWAAGVVVNRLDRLILWLQLGAIL